MSMKRITLDLEAYERLLDARRIPSESLSRVIMRATWPAPPFSGAGLRAALGSASPVLDEGLGRLDEVQPSDRPPA